MCKDQIRVINISISLSIFLKCNSLIETIHFRGNMYNICQYSLPYLQTSLIWTSLETPTWLLCLFFSTPETRISPGGWLRAGSSRHFLWSWMSLLLSLSQKGFLTCG